MKANQVSYRPTNKLLTGALVGPAASEAWSAIMTIHYPELAGPAVSMLVGAVAAALVGWFVRDKLNIPAESEYDESLTVDEDEAS